MVNWRRRHPDFPTPAAGTPVHPEFDRRQVVEWLLAHDKIAVPTAVPAATLTVGPALGPGTSELLRMDDPLLELSDDPEGEDLVSGWMTDADADTLARLTAEGASLLRLTAPGTTPLAVPDAVRVTERFRAGSGGLRVTLAWPSPLRGTASPHTSGGVIRHALPYTAPAPGAAAQGRPAAASSPPPTAPTTAPPSHPRWNGTPPTAPAAPHSAHTAAPASPGA